MAESCVNLPISTIYSTPIHRILHESVTTTLVTIPATTATVSATSTICLPDPTPHRKRDLHVRDCPFGTEFIPYTTVTTYPASVTEEFRRTLVPLIITESPVPVQTLYSTSCTSLSSSSSPTSFNSISTTSSISSSSSTSSSSSSSSSSTSTSTSPLTSTNSSTITSTSSSTLTTSFISTPTSFNSTSISTANSASTTSVQTSTSSASPPPSSSSSSRTSPSQTKTQLTQTHSPSPSQTGILLTISHDSSSRPITLTISSSAANSSISSPLLPISSHASLEATSTPILTRSLALESQADSAQTRPQTQTVAQTAATETNQAHTVAGNTRPASAQLTPNPTPNQSQQQASADRVNPSNRPTGQPNANTPQATQRVTNNNTSQQTAPATSIVTLQPSNSLAQATTVQASTPGATSAVLPQASITGGAVGPNSQATLDHHRKPNIGAIVGGTLGALVLLLIIGAAAVKYLKAHSRNGSGGRGREEDVGVTQSLTGDVFQGGLFAGGVAGGVGGQGAGSGKGGPGNKQTGPGEGGSGPHDPEMTQVYNNHAPPTESGGEQVGPSSQFPQHPQGAGPSTVGDNGAVTTQPPSGHPVGGYGTGTGGAEGVHGAGEGGHGNVAPHAGGGGGSYGNVAPGAGGGGGGGGGGHAITSANGGGGAGNAGAGGGGQAGAGGNAPTAPPGSGSGSGPVGTDVSNPGTYFDPTHGTIPPGSDLPLSAAGGHHGPGFIPAIVPVGARKRPATRASQSALLNTLPTPYSMTGAATYDGGHPEDAGSSTSLVGGNNSRTYSLSDGLDGGPAYGGYEDPFEEGQGLLPSYETGPGPAAAIRRRNEKDYR